MTGDQFIKDIETRLQHKQLSLDEAIQQCRDYIFDMTPGATPSAADKGKVRQFRRQLEAQKVGGGPSTAPVGPSTSQLAGDLALAEQDIYSRDWDAALDKLAQILDADPANDGVVALLEEIADKGVIRTRPRIIALLEGVDPALRTPRADALLQRLTGAATPPPPSPVPAPPPNPPVQLQPATPPQTTAGQPGAAATPPPVIPGPPLSPAAASSQQGIDNDEAYRLARLAMDKGDWEQARGLASQIDSSYSRYQAVEDMLRAIQEGEVYDRVPTLKSLPGKLGSARNRRNWPEVDQLWAQVETEIDAWRTANPGQRIDIPDSLKAIHDLSLHQRDAEAMLSQAIPLRESAQFAKAATILEEAKGLDSTNGVILDEIDKCKTGVANRKFVFSIKRGSTPTVDELVAAREKGEELLDIAPHSADVADLDTWVVDTIRDRVRQLKQRVSDRVAAVGRDKMLDDKVRDITQAEQAVQGIERLAPKDADLPDMQREVEELKDRLDTARRSRDDVDQKLGPYFQGQAMLTPTLASGFLRDLQVVEAEAPEDAKLGTLSTRFADGMVRAVQQSVKFPAQVTVSTLQQAAEMTDLIEQAPARPRTGSIDGLRQEIVRQGLAAVTERLKFGANDPARDIQAQLEEAAELAEAIPPLYGASQFPAVQALPTQLQTAAARAVRARLQFMAAPAAGGPPAPIPTDEAKGRLAEATLLADTAIDLPRDGGPDQPERLRGVILQAGVDAVVQRLEIGPLNDAVLAEAEDLAAAVRQLPGAAGAAEVAAMDDGLQSARRKLGYQVAGKTVWGRRVPILATLGILTACAVMWLVLNPPSLIRAAQEQIALALTPSVTPTLTLAPTLTRTPAPSITPTPTPGVLLRTNPQITLPGSDCDYLDGRNVCNEPRNGPAFKNYYRANRDILGSPISDILNENGRDVQYFQYGRLEHHPSNAGTPYEYQMGLLAQELAKALADRGQRSLAEAMAPVAADAGRGQWFPETNHDVSSANGFLRYFVDHGGLDAFGYPISEEFQDGDTLRQYFQRHILVKKAGQDIERAWVGFDYLAIVRSARVCHPLHNVDCPP